MISNVTVIGNREVETRRVFYTGKNINATAGSRTAIAVDLRRGHVLVMDPYGHDQRTNSTTPSDVNYTRAQTSFLHSRKVVVVNVPAGSERGGWVEVADVATFDGEAWCNANIAVGDVLAVTNGNFGLILLADIANGADIGQADAKALGAACFTAAHAADTSGTAALGRVIGYGV